jgi:phenylpropionate dioxygenase-like ring-hydroxylating dioxygenase large terminal subunit
MSSFDYNVWFAVLESSEVKKHQLYGATRIGQKMVFYRDTAGEVHALADKCCHRGASISCGKHLGNEIMCPFHGLRYDSTGKVTLIPSRGTTVPVPENFHVKAYPTREAHGIIYVWNGDEREEYPEPPFFENLTPRKYKYITHICPWTEHYTRCVENQLDVSHLPFVHADSIGRGNRVVCDGPYVETVEGEKSESDYEMKFYTFSHVENGTPGILPKDISKPDREQYLHFKFPNIWENNILDSLKVVAFFAPVDEHNSVVYVRGYMSGIGALFKGFTDLLNQHVLHQDQFVVQTQIPDQTEYKMDENLFPADAPIIEYRRIHDVLKNRAPAEE